MVGFESVSVFVNSIVRRVFHRVGVRGVRWMRGKPVLDSVASVLEPVIGDQAEDQRTQILEQLNLQTQSLLREQGFVELSADQFQSGRLEPETCWQRPFTWAEIKEGYPIDREIPPEDDELGQRRSVTGKLLEELQAGGQAVLLGQPGAGKTTVSKMIAYRWYADTDTGMVLYRGSGSGNSITNIEPVRQAVEAGREEGPVLVVVEDGARAGAISVFELVQEYEGTDDVAILLNARRSEWNEIDSTIRGSELIDARSTVGRELIQATQRAVSEVAVPRPDSREVERLFSKYEAVTGQVVAHSPEELLDSLGKSYGVSPLLLATYYLPTRKTGSLDLESDVSPITRHVAETYQQLQSISLDTAPEAVTNELLTRVALLVNSLNAAGIGVRREHLHTLAADAGNHSAMDWILDAYDGILLFGTDESGEYYVPHRHWSITYLQHSLDKASSQQALRHDFEHCVNQLLKLVTDDELQDQLRDWFSDDELLEEYVDHATGIANTYLMKLVEIGTDQPRLAPLFATQKHSNIRVPSVCEWQIDVNIAFSRARMYQHRGEFDIAEQELEWAASRLRSTDAGDIDQMLADSIIHFQFAVLAANQANYREARKYYQWALRLTKEIGESSYEGKVRNNLAGVLLELGQYQQAHNHAKVALEIAREEDDESEIVVCLGSVGHVALKLDDLDTAEEYYTESLQRAEERGDRTAIADRLCNLGSVYKNTGRPELAEQRFTDSLQLSREIGHTSKIVTALQNLGNLYFDQSDFETAIEYYREAKETAESPVNQASALNQLGKSVRSLERLDEAERYFRDSIAILENSLPTPTEASGWSGLGLTLLLKGEGAEAREAFDTALDVIESTDDQSQLTTTLFNAATVAIATGRLEIAKDLCNQSIQIQKQLGNKHEQALVYQKLGQIARFEHRYSDAVDTFETSYTLLQDADSAGDAVDVAYKAVKAAQRVGDTEAAEKFCQRGLDAADESGRGNLDRTVMALAGTKSSFEDSWEATVDLYWRSLCCLGGGELRLALQMLYSVWERADQQQTDELDEVFGGTGILLAAFARLGWIEGVSTDEFIPDTTQYVDSVSEPMTSLHHALAGHENNVTSVELPAENEVEFSTASIRELEQRACSQLLPLLTEQQSEIESTTE